MEVWAFGLWIHPGHPAGMDGAVGVVMKLGAVESGYDLPRTGLEHIEGTQRIEWQAAGDGVAIAFDVSGELQVFASPVPVHLAVEIRLVGQDVSTWGHFEAVVGFQAQIGGEEDFDAV